jgi:hypothetical protein
MRATSSWVWLVVALAAIVIVSAAVAKGRGGSDDEVGKRAACIANKRAYARYVVVNDAYERGELGSRREVMRTVHPKARGAIFEPDGDLRQWSAMNRAGKHEFLQWATSDPTYRKTRSAQDRATDAITRADCE